MKRGTKALIVVLVVLVIGAGAGVALLPRVVPGMPALVKLPLPPGRAPASGPAGPKAASGAGSKPDPNAAPESFSAPVAVTRARTGSARETLVLYGSVFPRAEVSIFTTLAGKVTALRVEQGDRVAKGQLLAVLDRDQAGLKFAPVEVTSTISGTVKSVLTEVGATVSPAAPLFQVVDMGVVEVAVNVPEKMIGRVRPGQAVEIGVVAYPEQTFTGAVSRLSPVVDLLSRTLETRIRVPNGRGLLRPGMFAEARVILRQEEQIVLIPVAALVDRESGRLVFIVQGSTAREVYPRIAFVEGETAAVEEGINDGDQLVVVGQQSLSDGDEVNIVEQRP